MAEYGRKGRIKVRGTLNGPDMAAALAADGPARRVLAALAYSHRKRYNDT